MKTIIFYGSPMKDGNTMALVNEMTHVLEGEVKVIDCYHKNIAPCKDCKYCFHKTGCSIKDDMQEIYEDIEDSDAVIIATPMHFGSVSAPMFTMFSRLQSYWSSTYIRKENRTEVKPKYGILAVTAGSKWMNMELLVEGIAKFAFGHMNAEQIGTVFAKETDQFPVKENKKVLDKAKYLAQRLNALGNQ